MRFFRIQNLAGSMALSLVFAAAGCQLPDVGPFVSATGQLKAAVASSGTAVEQELRLMPDGAGYADQLHEEWAKRNEAMTALLRYAGSLDKIVTAGQSGAASAGKVADSVKGLAQAAGVAIPGSPEALAVASDTAKFLYAQIALVRAAKDLAVAMEQAQPAVEKIGELLAKDIRALDEVVRLANTAIETAIAREYADLVSYRKSVSEAIKETHDLSTEADRVKLVELSKLMADVDARYAVYQSKLGANNERLRASRQLIAATVAALEAWTSAHAQLAVAAKHKQVVNTEALTQATLELRTLIGRIREL